LSAQAGQKRAIPDVRHDGIRLTFVQVSFGLAEPNLVDRAAEYDKKNGDSNVFCDPFRNNRCVFGGMAGQQEGI
jgi:hypothetical protein